MANVQTPAITSQRAFTGSPWANEIVAIEVIRRSEIRAHAHLERTEGDGVASVIALSVSRLPTLDFVATPQAASNPNAEWASFAASAMRASSMITAILISEVEII